VPTVDTLVAPNLLKTVAAARLMGADCIVSGIRPQIAQTMVHLGVELNVVSKASLADAFALALQRTGKTVVQSKAASGQRCRHKPSGSTVSMGNELAHRGASRCRRRATGARSQREPLRAMVIWCGVRAARSAPVGAGLEAGKKVKGSGRDDDRAAAFWCEATFASVF